MRDPPVTVLVALDLIDLGNDVVCRRRFARFLVFGDYPQAISLHRPRPRLIPKCYRKSMANGYQPTPIINA
jgi:hypothetical protein